MYAASTGASVSPLMQDKILPVDTILELSLRSAGVKRNPLLLKAPLGRTFNRGGGASGGNAVGLPKQFVWAS